MRRLPLLLLACLAVGCGVGNGTGAASGSLFVLDCSSDGDYCFQGVCGTPTAPVPFDLHPEFFGGDSLDDLHENDPGSFPRKNRLLIRLQRSGKRIERNDVLTIDVVDSVEVARCVRGRYTVAADGSLQPDFDTRYCGVDPATGQMRIRISVERGLIHASLAPAMTCTRLSVAWAADALTDDGLAPLPEAPQNYRSWIVFSEFGSAAQPTITDPTLRDPVSPKFRVEFDQQLNATAFFVELVDSKVLNSVRLEEPPPLPDIGGSLQGNFDFKFVRGEGAQFFP